MLTIFGDFKSELASQSYDSHRYPEPSRSTFVLRVMTPAKRYAHLKATRPWVLELAENGDVANYLRVSVNMLKEFQRG